MATTVVTPYLSPIRAVGAVEQTLRVLCLWEGWDVLEPLVASTISGDVRDQREPGSQSPYETRLTGEMVKLCSISRMGTIAARFEPHPSWRACVRCSPALSSGLSSKLTHRRPALQ